MKDEFTRMKLIDKKLHQMNLTDKKLHAIYVGNDFKEYKIFVSVCQEYGIYAHSFSTLAQLPALLKKIFRGHYDVSRAYFKKPPSNLTHFQRSLAVLPGISEEIAAKAPWTNLRDMAFTFSTDDSMALRVLSRMFGVKMDGTIKRLGLDFLIYYKTGEWRGKK
jgi:hypothetical protein